MAGCPQADPNGTRLRKLRDIRINLHHLRREHYMLRCVCACISGCAQKMAHRRLVRNLGAYVCMPVRAYVRSPAHSHGRGHDQRRSLSLFEKLRKHTPAGPAHHGHGHGVYHPIPAVSVPCLSQPQSRSLSLLLHFSSFDFL